MTSDKKLNLSFSKTGFMLGIAVTMLSSCNKTEEKPNILWITIEDTSPQFVGYAGNEQVKTPVIDQLAREGVIFTNAFSSGPVCSASRSTLITGVNTEQLGTGNHRSKYPIPEYIRGFPAYLRDVGYYTSNNVKTDYNTSREKDLIASAWDESSNKAGWWNRGEGQNFFSVVNFTNCHQSRTMTNPWAWYEEMVLERLSVEDLTGADEIDVPPIYRDTDEMRRNLSRVYNSMNLTDIEISLLVDSLKRDGLMESTIIFFFADHGEAIPRGKSSSIGLSYSVPFFIWFPEKYKHLSPWNTGGSTDELINFEDLPPTVLSLAGAEIPAYMTGRPFLGKQRKEPSPFVFGSRNRIDESPDLVRTATDGRFFYTREFFPRYPSVLLQKYADVSDIVRAIRRDYADGKLNREQSIMLGRRDMEYLYDMDNDPWELNNLANNPEYAGKLNEMRNALYERLLENKDIHFLHEYAIQQISEDSNPYEFRLSSNYPVKEIIDAAYEASDPSTSPERLFEMLESSNEHIRYWAATGIHNNISKAQIEIGKLAIAMMDDYPPVVIETAAIALEHFNNKEAKEILKKFILDRNLILSMNAMQMLQYMEHVSDDILDVVQLLSDKTNNKEDGYFWDYHVNSCCDMLLYKHRGKPLFIPEFEKWTDPEYLERKK